MSALPKTAAKSKWQAYKEGMNDDEAGTWLGCGPLAIARWRRRHGLPPQSSLLAASFRKMPKLPPRIDFTPRKASKRADEPSLPVALARGSDWHIVSRTGQFWLKDVETEELDPWDQGLENPVAPFMEDNDWPPALLFSLVGNGQTHLISTPGASEEFLLILAPGMSPQSAGAVRGLAPAESPGLGPARAFLVRLDDDQIVSIHGSSGDHVVDITPLARPKLLSPGLTDFGRGFAIALDPEVRIDSGLPPELGGSWLLRANRWNRDTPEPAFTMSSDLGSSEISIDLRRMGRGRSKLEILEFEESEEPVTALTLYWDPRLESATLDGYSPIPQPAGHAPIQFTTKVSGTVQTQTFNPGACEDDLGIQLFADDRATWIHLAVPRIWWRRAATGQNQIQEDWTDKPIAVTGQEIQAGTRLELYIPDLVSSVKLVDAYGESVHSRAQDGSRRSIGANTLSQIASTVPVGSSTRLSLQWGDQQATLANVWGTRRHQSRP